MKIYLLISLLICTFSFNLRHAKQSYDSYVMAVQWPNCYCKINNCGDKANHVIKNTMTIHGFWPSLKSGQTLSTCTSGVEIKDNGDKLFQEMRQYWPSFVNSNEDFWEHEYNKHGYCMVEDYGWDGYEDYFEFVLQLFNKQYRDLIKNAFPGTYNNAISVTYEEMKKRINNIIKDSVFIMKCKSKFIYEFRFYLQRNFTPSPKSKLPESCANGVLVFK